MKRKVAIMMIFVIMLTALTGCKSPEMTVRWEFFKHWTLKGYELIDLEFDREMPDGTVVYKSTFKTPGRTDGSLSPNKIYSGWTWDLERTPFGWKIVGYGYG